MELLTLVQTKKLRKKVPVVVYDRKYWEKVVNFDFLAKSGTVSIEDLGLFHFSDTVDDAFKFLTEALTDAHL
jgi:predicted Rossmann-fold nucleotide-binding protein